MPSKLLLIFSIFFISLITKAQTGSISGAVLDAKTNEGLIGAVVRIDGSQQGSQVDIDGNFLISQVAEGAYQLSISYISYATQKIKVIVENGKTTQVQPILLLEESKMMEEIVVKATKRTHTENAILIESKKADQIIVGISAQQIAKTQDRDAAQVVRRVPGVNIVDNRFVMVRGLNERYNTVLLNDALTPSTEIDVRSFSFDLIPSNTIDRMLIFKTASAENSGEMAGGIIKIYTKSRPDANS
ncbi:MAG TPA: carboxypeptidase-like regulatory domain-containing protein, partial [Chitinophagales bacterium]|nr:carboxypeptidase-like regulatory domain-containing protein [Chitinophagales bacterium]